MALDDMLQIIEDEGALRCTEIKARAESEVERIIRQAKSDAESIREEAYKKYTEKAPAEANRMISKEKLNSRLQIMQARETMIMQAFETAKDRLDKIRKEAQYDQVLTALINEALDEAGGSCEIHVNPQDVERAKKAIAGREGVSDVIADEDVKLGCYVRTDDGSIQVINDLLSRFDLIAHRSKTLIAERLFAEKR